MTLPGIGSCLGGEVGRDSHPERHRRAARAPLPRPDRTAGGGAAPPPAARTRGRGSAVVRAWCDWLSPHFAGNDSAYLTLTYSDDYGYPHGCMLPRNCQSDVRRWVHSLGLEARRFIWAVEPHRDRTILHLHGIIEGPFTFDQRGILEAAWRQERGWARVLPVLDGCESYVTKYALKSTVEAFDFNL